MLALCLRRSARPALLVLLLLMAGCGPDTAGPDYPALTGRVVDQAGMLSAGAEAALDRQLAAHEAATGQQVVVVTLESLQGESIEAYGVGLGRHWGIGREGEDGGVLLIVAPNERAVRIEIGYGLEGTLTDALASQIIHNEILPRFRAGDMEGGIVAGTGAILSALGGTYSAGAWSGAGGGRAASPPHQGIPDAAVPFLFFIAWAIIVFFLRRRRGLTGGMIGGMGWGGIGRGRGLGGRRGGFSGGGFSGGGGSFGGGGASGRW